jgi:hypothetical protein
MTDHAARFPPVAAANGLAGVTNTASKAVGDEMRAARRVVRRSWVDVYEAIQSMEGDDIRAGLTNPVEGA